MHRLQVLFLQGSHALFTSSDHRWLALCKASRVWGRKTAPAFCDFYENVPDKVLQEVQNPQESNPKPNKPKTPIKTRSQDQQKQQNPRRNPKPKKPNTPKPKIANSRRRSKTKDAKKNKIPADMPNQRNQNQYQNQRNQNPAEIRNQKTKPKTWFIRFWIPAGILVSLVLVLFFWFGISAGIFFFGFGFGFFSLASRLGFCFFLVWVFLVSLVSLFWISSESLLFLVSVSLVSLVSWLFGFCWFSWFGASLEVSQLGSLVWVSFCF